MSAVSKSILVWSSSPILTSVVNIDVILVWAAATLKVEPLPPAIPVPCVDSLRFSEPSSSNPVPAKSLTSTAKFSDPSSCKPSPAKSLTSISKVTEPPRVTEPPVFNPSPAVIVTASSANLAIGISSLSICVTIAAAN